MNRTDFEEQLIEYIAGELPPDVATEMAAYIRESPEAAMLEREFRLVFEAGNAIRTNTPPIDLMPQANALLLKRLKYRRTFSLNGKTHIPVHRNTRESFFGQLRRPRWRPISVFSVGILLLTIVAIISGRRVIAEVAEFTEARLVQFDDQGGVEVQTIPQVEVSGNETILHFADGSIDTVPTLLPPDAPRRLSPKEEEELAKSFRGKSAILLIHHSNVAGKETTTPNDSSANMSWGAAKADTTNPTSR